MEKSAVLRVNLFKKGKVTKKKKKKKKRLVLLQLSVLNCIFLNEFDILSTNMAVLFVANKYFSRYEHFCAAIKSH